MKKFLTIRYLVFLVSAWLALIFLFYVFSEKFEKIDLPYLPDWLNDTLSKNALFLKHGEVTFWSLFDVGNWAIFLTIFLSTLGAFGGLTKILQGIRKSHDTSFSSERRSNLMVLGGAITAAIVVGTSTVFISAKRKFVLSKLYILEVNLVRFEGLLFNSIAVVDKDGLFESFLTYLLGYYGKIETLLKEIRQIYDFDEGTEIDYQMSAAADDMSYIVKNGLKPREVDESDPYSLADPFRSMLVRLEAMQEIVRRHIRKLETR